MSRPYRDEFGPPEKIAKSTILSEVLEDAKFKGKVIEYVWDFGLNWSHIITVKGRAETTDTMVCLSGKNKPPGEYPPFFIDRFKRKDKEDVNHRLARLRSKSNEIHDGDGGEDDEEEHEDFDEEHGEEDREEGYPYSSPESHPGLDRSAAAPLTE
jgi:Plasmid pRiA4b ORF-3-like protein